MLLGEMKSEVQFLLLNVTLTISMILTLADYKNKKQRGRERERPLEDRGATKVEELGKEKGGEVEEEEEEEKGAGDVVEQPNECFFRTLHLLLFLGGL